MLPIFIRLTRVLGAAHQTWLLNVQHVLDVVPSELGGCVVFTTSRPKGERVNQSLDVVQTLIEEAQDRILFAGAEDEDEEAEEAEDVYVKLEDVELGEPLDTWCATCFNESHVHKTQYQTPSGPTCFAGHGGADGIPKRRRRAT